MVRAPHAETVHRQLGTTDVTKVKGTQWYHVQRSMAVLHQHVSKTTSLPLPLPEKRSDIVLVVLGVTQGSISLSLV